MKMMTGVVEKIDFTHGGAGNQWTTISGVRYATFWDFRSIDWKVGDTVTFEAVDLALWEDSPVLPHANKISKATTVVAVASRSDIADAEFERYDFGPDVTVLQSDNWDTSDKDDLTKIVYIEGDSQDEDSERISFHVRFNPDGTVDDAYGLLMRNGADIGNRGVIAESLVEA